MESRASYLGVLRFRADVVEWEGLRWKPEVSSSSEYGDESSDRDPLFGTLTLGGNHSCHLRSRRT